VRIAPQKIKWLTRGFWHGATRYEISLRVNREVNSNLHVEQPALSSTVFCSTKATDADAVLVRLRACDWYQLRRLSEIIINFYTWCQYCSCVHWQTVVILC